MIYFGDTARCPYGTRTLAEVKGFVDQICEWMLGLDVKLIIIACNTATAAGLEDAKERLPIPVLGVIEPGAIAAVKACKNNRIGVVATEATIASQQYAMAIRKIDSSITVFSSAAPKFVEIVEQGLRIADGKIEDFTSSTSKAFIRPAFQKIAIDYLEPLRRCDVDTLVLGCTHFPLLKALIGGVMGSKVELISSASEIAKQTCQLLERENIGSAKNRKGKITYYSSSQNTDDFVKFGSSILNNSISQLQFKAFE